MTTAIGAIQQDFPFDEIRDATGNYFASVADAMKAGYQESQIWSVVIGDGVGPNGEDVYTYGPSHHYVNVMGYIATKEHHNNETYYDEFLDRDDWDWQEAFCKFGFDDGDGWNGTYLVAAYIDSKGYECVCDWRGSHNFMIMDILKNKNSILFEPDNLVKVMRWRLHRKWLPHLSHIKDGIGYARPESYLPSQLVNDLNARFHDNHET